MPNSDPGFPNTHRRTRLGARRHGFVSARISRSYTHAMMKHEYNIPFLSHRARSAERGAYRDIEHEHYPVNIIRDEEHPAGVALALTRTRASRVRPRLSEEHWVIVFCVRRHPEQVVDQRRP